MTLTMRTPPSDTSTRGRQNVAQQLPVTSANQGKTGHRSPRPPPATMTTAVSAQIAPIATVSTRPNVERYTAAIAANPARGVGHERRPRGCPGPVRAQPRHRLLGRRGVVSGGRQRRVRPVPRRGAGHRRRVRIGQVDHGDGDARSAAEERLGARLDQAARQGDRRDRRLHVAADPWWRGVDDLPGADDGAQPGVHRRVPDLRDAPQPLLDEPEGRLSAGDRVAHAGRDPRTRAARRRLSSPALRRPTATGDDRPGVGDATRRCWLPTSRRRRSTSPCRPRSSS